MTPKAWAIFIGIFIFVLGGLVGVGFVLDTLYPVGFLTVTDTSTGGIDSMSFTFIFMILGVFFGIFIGYRAAWHFTIGKNIEREMRRLEGLLLDELNDNLEKGGRNGHDS